MPTEITATVSGITNGSCGNCAAVNGVYTLFIDDVSDCNQATWSSLPYDSGCGSETGPIRLIWFDNAWSLIMGIGANGACVATGTMVCDGISTWTIADEDLGGYCHGPVTIVLDSRCSGSGSGGGSTSESGSGGESGSGSGSGTSGGSGSGTSGPPTVSGETGQYACANGKPVTLYANFEQYLSFGTCGLLDKTVTLTYNYTDHRWYGTLFYERYTGCSCFIAIAVICHSTLTSHGWDIPSGAHDTGTVSYNASPFLLSADFTSLVGTASPGGCGVCNCAITVVVTA